MVQRQAHQLRIAQEIFTVGILLCNNDCATYRTICSFGYSLTEDHLGASHQYLIASSDNLPERCRQSRDIMHAYTALPLP